jgi:hypothetical protein
VIDSEEALKEEAFKKNALKDIVGFNLDNALNFEASGRLWLKIWNESEEN